MIKIENESEGLKKSIFEFFRMKLPKTYKDLNFNIKIKLEDQIIFISIFGENINTSGMIRLQDEKAHFTIKRYLFDLFFEEENFDSSFGILTGVRPLKLLAKVFEGSSYDESMKILWDRYRIGRDEGDFLYKIYKNQEDIRLTSNINKYNVYVHIPFCPSRCFYCSFDTTIEDKEKMDLYTKNLVEDINSHKLEFSGEANSIYIGGGTPTSIGLDNLGEIIDSINNKFGLTREFTVECGRIDSLSLEILKMLKDKGVNRISLNPQTFNEDVINKLNRVSNKDFEYWFKAARELGFETINMDLIMGLPGENKESILSSIERAIEFSPENITIHTLALKNGSKLFENSYHNEEDFGNLLEESKKLLIENNYEPYYLYRQKKSVI
ncbi:MAG: radical SAM protein [Peptoniphilus harei]|nr:radical SAM protein [Peptoniphilus harei]MDU5470949.1 radical SAM protein [Peptoniphilus harei]